MANPSGNHEEDQTTHVASSFNGNLAVDTSPTALAMKHNSGIALDWTPQEQTILEEGLSLEKKIARERRMNFQGKVKIERKKLACNVPRFYMLNKKKCWLERNSIEKVKKGSKSYVAYNCIYGKLLFFQEKVSDPAVRSSHFTAQSNVFPYAPAMKMMDNDDSISHKAIGGPAGELLEQNAQALNNISTNLAALQFQDNINLFNQTRDNIVRILNDMNDMSEVMKQMPPLPFKINETIFSSIFPKTIHQML